MSSPQTRSALYKARATLKWWQQYLHHYRSYEPKWHRTTAEQEILARWDRERIQRIHAEFYRALDEVWLCQVLERRGYGDWHG